MMLRPITGPLVRPLTRRVTEPGFGWSPRALFASGEQGAWYDPSDLSSMNTKHDGSGAVPGVGDPVGYIADKSGRGNHAKQATDTARPTLQLASGRYYLQFDGVDDFLSCPFAPTAYPFTLAVAALASANTDGAALSMCESEQRYKALRKSTSANVWTMEDRILGSRILPLLSGSNNIPHVLMGKLLTDTTGISIDGSAYVSLANPNVFGAPVTLLIGNLRVPSSIFLTGRIYGALIVGTDLSSGSTASVQRFLASKAGVTLA